MSYSYKILSKFIGYNHKCLILIYAKLMNSFIFNMNCGGGGGGNPISMVFGFEICFFVQN